MPLSDGAYVPALRWRQAEYQALFRLKEPVKRRVVPLLTIPPVEFDFEVGELKKTVHEHVQPFVPRYLKKWGCRPAWLALDESIESGRMNGGVHVFDFILDGLRPQALVIPVMTIGPCPDTKAAVARAVLIDQHGIGLIVRLEDVMRDDVGTRIEILAAEIGCSLDEVDVLIDMKAPNYEPYAAFAESLVCALRNLGDTGKFRNFVLLGTAIPSSLRSVARGSDQIPRHDWLFFRELIGRMPTAMRRPSYGDHTIVHPSFVALDMRAVRPAAKLLYTTSKTWATRKGSAFRDDRTQMQAHCSEIISDSRFGFRGGGFSDGDQYIEMCAAGRVGPSNLSRWKEVCISHHITTVADDLANFAAGSSTA